MPQPDATLRLLDTEKYMVHFGILSRLFGPSEKWQTNNALALKCACMSKAFLVAGEIDQAILTARLSTKLCSRNHATYALMLLNLLEVTLTKDCNLFEDSKFLEQAYHDIFSTMTFHLGKDHPLILTLNDKFALISSQCQNDSLAFGFVKDNLSLSKRILGPNHPTTAGYMTKVID